MDALVCTTPGKFEYKKIAEPIPVPGNSILKIKRVGVCGTDLHAFEGTQPFFNYPRILGHEIAGEIVQTDASGFREAEMVTVLPYFNCGNCIACRNGKPNCCVSLKVCGVHVDGAMVEYLSVPSNSLIHADGLDLEMLALVEPLSIGAHGVRRAEVHHNEFVLVMGAGPIGLGIMEFARITGGKIIALDVNESRLEFCSREFGVEYTVNAAKTNSIDLIRDITSGDMPTVVIDATGNLNAIQDGFRYLAHGGRYVLVGLQKEEISFSHPEFHKREATLMSSRNATKTDFDQAIDAIRNKNISAGKFITHRLKFGAVEAEFKNLIDPSNRVIKAVIEIN